MFTKTNYAGYEKDVSSNFVINKNTEEYALHIQNREKAKEFRRMAKEIEKLKSQMAILEAKVQSILNSQNGTING